MNLSNLIDACRTWKDASWVLAQVGEGVRAGRAWGHGFRQQFGGRASKAWVPTHREPFVGVPDQKAILAGGLGFEPRNGLPRQRFSRPSPSSARPSSQVGAYREIELGRATFKTVDLIGQTQPLAGRYGRRATDGSRRAGSRAGFKCHRATVARTRSRVRAERPTGVRSTFLRGPPRSATSAGSSKR
jgi:hypothetical protein